MKKPELKRIRAEMEAAGYDNIAEGRITLHNNTKTWSLSGHGPTGRPYWFIAGAVWKSMQAETAQAAKKATEAQP